MESMTDIVVKSISFMKNDAGLSAWTDFAEVQAKAQKIHNDSAFLLSVFEGKGTSTYEVFKEVQPTPKYLDPFVDFLADKIKVMLRNFRTDHARWKLSPISTIYRGYPLKRMT